jgi:hypothetical protein
MNEEEVLVAEQVLAETRQLQHTSTYDPSHEVEMTLVSLLRHRIDKIQEDSIFEQQVKEALLARLPEADFSELIRLLDSVQLQTNISVEKILSPFIPRVGERVPLLDNDTERGKKNMDEQVFDKASKDVLNALAELGKLGRVLNTLPKNNETLLPPGNKES